uniref:Uncharacterized protein n=1 Tax=Mucochytrium quahogii TaxID=96639 RepID=A0A7S2WL55_9STRA|mmetsp:Transcript_3107/g.6565  ORF Transcript_3107/g.6565 Transcript_3107/m.6565 type:complete len:102 (+) Transcript_3107:3-308(+)
MNKMDFQQHWAIPKGLPKTVPSQTEFVDWSNVPFVDQAIRASLPVSTSSLHSYRMNGLSVLPCQQVAQPPQSYTAGMVLQANLDWLSSAATGGTGGGGAEA